MTRAKNTSRQQHRKRQHSSLLGGLMLAALFTTAATTYAQDQRGDWSLPGGDVGQTGWQKGEFNMTPENAATQFKFLWKYPFGHAAGGTQTFSEPIMIGRVINGQGFKDIIFGTSADTLYAVDSELGSLIWKKQFDPVKTAAGCTPTHLSMLMEPPIVINFAARRKRPPGTPRPPDPPLVESKERRIGLGAGGGYFGFKGVYVVTADGMLHEQIVTTGGDYGPAVKFLPTGASLPFGLNFSDKTIYTETAAACGGNANGMYSIDLKSAEYPVANLSTDQVHPVNISGPVMTGEGVSVMITGKDTGDAKPEDHAGSVVVVTKDLKVKDWFTPNGGMATLAGASPILVEHKDKVLVAAPGKDGTIVLLDLASLGGSDHQTPLFETPSLTTAGAKHSWDGFATWTDTAGNMFVYASISAGVTLSDGSLQSSAPTAHGAVVAFKLEDQDGKLSLHPVWVSGDMVNPAPPRIANGVLAALAGGDAQNHAVLHIFNASTGKEIFNSKDEIKTYTQLSGVSFGDSHVFFTDHDNVLYSFGIALEH
jgi:outer membrane protein assembly factor BamB